MEYAVLVDPGWSGQRRLAGSRHLLLAYPNGVVRFRHDCRKVDGVQLVTAPRLQLDNGHRVTKRDRAGVPLTVEPSILCADCGLHGFARGGRWVSA